MQTQTNNMQGFAGDDIQAPAMQQPAGALMPPQSAPRPVFAQLAVWPDPSTVARPPEMLQDHLSATTSKGYKGVWNLDRNVSADVPNSQNCSTYLTGLPPTLGYYDLLRCLRFGKVVQTHISPPGASHRNSAAKVVFSNRTDAERLQAAVRDGTFSWPGSRVNFMWNRVKVAAQDASEPCSRAIRVTGPPQYVNELDLCAFMWSQFYFDLEEIVTIEHESNETTLEIRFGSLWFQSENAFHNLRSTHAQRQYLSVEWARDPCDIDNGTGTESH